SLNQFKPLLFCAFHSFHLKLCEMYDMATRKLLKEVLG
ncbi:MAG: hypothetical protein ACI9OH_000910, partial [Oleispira sp.]